MSLEVEKFEGLIAEAMLRDHVPGLSLAIVKDGKIVYAKGFGSRNLKAGLKATPDTLYGIGSCTKSFTALALMQLQEQGKLNVNDPVRKYLPEFKIGKEEKPITIHHLLSHSSGIPDLGAADIEINRFLGIEEKWIPFASFDDAITFINGATSEIVAEPGKRFFYLNEGYTLLGWIIERTSNMRYEDYVRENILKPLKMNRSAFPSEKIENDADVATPYLVQKKEGIFAAVPTVLPLDRLAFAAGGLLSSVMELANYLTAYLSEGFFEGSQILGSTLLREMYKPHIDVGYSTFFGKRYYGYGWRSDEDFFGHRCIGHSGSTLVSNADLRFLPDLKLGVAVASNNGAAESVYMVAPVVLTLLIGKDPVKEIPVFEIEKKMSILVGEYESYKGIAKISVTRKGGILFAKSKEKLVEQCFALIPESDKLENLRFYIFAGGTRMPVEFAIDDSGRVDLFIERNRFHKIK
ncbi:serine hydrolase [Candidatus Bathyarchaeota archaeon]|nr:serine hydrolase [Candidatus Bathyarchaeota archaeon]